MQEAQTPAQRRAQITANIVATTGIDEAMIERLVRQFYAKIATDDLLGPIFAARIADWEAHLQRMCAFWSSVALLSGRYHGSPMAKHQPLPVDGRHFDHWLMLFERTARDVCSPVAADHFIERARRIAESLELGIAGGQGVLLAKGARYRNEQLHVSAPDAITGKQGVGGTV
ncbi:MAG: group III truncated hemoglobin [Rhizobiaceae bacterium]|nr:group III truncated hemoglobin [Rhizobiaceae bacterium]|tara:strand:- start:460 stop:975 length:516 start_codon:yes stop_codon:yes gene_type:complete